MKPCLLAFAWWVLALAGCSHQDSTAALLSQDHPSFLWKITKGKTHAWLLGTMHVADSRVTTLPLEVEEAFHNADAIYTEIEATPSLAGKLMQAGRLGPNQFLRNILPSPLYLRLNDYLESRGFARGSFDAYRPWMISLQLGQLDAIPYLKEGQAFDVALMNRARVEGKKFGAIETIEEQISTLESGSLEDHIHLLDVGLTKLEQEQVSGVNGFERMFHLYLAGQAEPLWAYALSETDLKDPIQAASWNTLLVQRNVRMASRIHQHLSETPLQSTLFAFGTLHFLGPESVVEHLISLGYQVNRVAHIPRTASTKRK